jgi:TolA-binding protein
VPPPPVKKLRLGKFTLFAYSHTGMSRQLKLVLYVVCIIGVVVFGALTVSSYREASASSARRAERLRDDAENTNAPAVLTNAIADTNLPADTNLVSTNAAATNVLAARPADAPESAGTSSGGISRMVTRGLGLLLFFLGLAALIAYDVSQFFARKAEESLFADDGAPADPEYEQAEELWKDGKYLDALNAMRSYLKKHPREQFVALRIAEIYEENLNNPLAAALEYEEVLKKKLPAERWGWAAIHLANLYSGKLNQPDKSVALLRRIDAEFGQTTAAKKARERLTQIDPGFVPANAPVVPVAADETTYTAAPSSNLPPGFRPKS